jgi:hypothetical protein
LTPISDYLQPAHTCFDESLTGLSLDVKLRNRYENHAQQNEQYPTDSHDNRGQPRDVVNRESVHGYRTTNQDDPEQQQKK